MAARTPRSPATPEPVQPPEAAAVTAEVAAANAPAAPAPSVLERLRRNRMGAVLGGLIVAIAVALLLSVLVPDSNLLLALALLGLAEAFAVGFTVRYLTDGRGWTTQATAFVLAAIGVHVMVTTGMVNQAIGNVGSLLGGVLGKDSGAASGLGWDDAVVAALATPSVSTGAVVCGLIAAIIAGWGPRSEARARRSDTA